jgi:UDPglucose 6-dehydrogenase
MGTDHRISPAFLGAGIGWGGSCFPKDVKALIHMAELYGERPEILRAVSHVNYDQRKRLIQKLRHILGGFRGKAVGLWGLAFKPDTDDMRDAPSISIVNMLQHEGAVIKAYDPEARENAERLVADVVFCDDPYQVAEDVDALILVTEWNEFKQLNMDRVKASMRQPVLIDGRNIYDAKRMAELGFTYRGMGRGYNGEGTV